VEIVLVRHGVRSATPDGADAGLTEHGRHQIEQLARALRHRACVVDCYLSSKSAHAQETARLLQEKAGAAGSDVVLLDSLTPRSGRGDVDTLLDQAHAVVADLDERQGLLVVGHEGRLSNLITELTGRRDRPLLHGEAVCISAAGLDELAAGRGEIRFRYPTFDHQEELLLSKVEAKVTTSTFLAGFVFTALAAVLVLTPGEWSISQVVAVIALTASLALFVACVFIYDQLSMPSGFWTDSARPRLWRRFYERAERRSELRWQAVACAAGPDAADERVAPMLEAGARHRLMVGTWTWLFTPASWCALIGFVALLINTGSSGMVIGSCLGLVGAGVLAVVRRPDLGAD
jgi:phosphohistidine phosphatase SixA